MVTRVSRDDPQPGVSGLVTGVALARVWRSSRREPVAATHLGLSHRKGRVSAGARGEVPEGALTMVSKPRPALQVANRGTPSRGTARRPDGRGADVGGLVRVDPVRFIQGELRHTSDRWAGRPFKLRAFQREFLAELFRETRAS